MKLLVVDDEDYIRNGVVASLNWGEIGIKELKEANDGLKGLEIANEFEPDIILADIRMPRMDGISMVYKVRENNPECCVIFMSGYSDKEYLKSAIKLSAITYVEKPVDLLELKEAIEKAVKHKKSEMEKMVEKKNTKMRLNTFLPVIRNEIALRLCEEGFLSETQEIFLDILKEEMPIYRKFVTIIIRTDDIFQCDEIYCEKLQNIYLNKC